jgi:hypothetical protein
MVTCASRQGLTQSAIFNRSGSGAFVSGQEERERFLIKPREVLKFDHIDPSFS